MFFLVIKDFDFFLVYKKTGVKRGFWGYRNWAPEWYPHDVQFCSPNDNTKGKYEIRKLIKLFLLSRYLILY